MKLERDTERFMLHEVVLPAIREVRQLIRENQTEKAGSLAARDILGLLMTYRDSEAEKYENAPENLKSAPQKQRMEDDVKRFDQAIAILYDEEGKTLRPIEKWDLDKLESIVTKVIEA